MSRVTDGARSSGNGGAESPAAGKQCMDSACCRYAARLGSFLKSLFQEQMESTEAVGLPACDSSTWINWTNTLNLG